MGISAKILFGRVMHQRILPQQHGFRYGIYYLLLPLPLAVRQYWPLFMTNRSAAIGFRDADHGPRDGGDLLSWATSICQKFGLTEKLNISLLAMPRVMGYGFNPVSFWFCRDDAEYLRAVICEVHNTFGETHSYFCARPDMGVITSDEWLTAEKTFHVSPFLNRDGRYQFRFHIENEKIGIWIDYYNADRQKQLITALTGHLVDLHSKTLIFAFLRYPMVAMMAVWRIHWNALKLWIKGAVYVPKPAQFPQKISATDGKNDF